VCQQELDDVRVLAVCCPVQCTPLVDAMLGINADASLDELLDSA
jgi:hypothetical protein